MLFRERVEKKKTTEKGRRNGCIPLRKRDYVVVTGLMAHVGFWEYVHHFQQE